MVEERVKKVLSQLFGIPASDINETTSPDVLEKWDSLAHMNLIIALEEEFGIIFNEIQVIEMLNYPLVLLAVKEAVESQIS